MPTEHIDWNAKIAAIAQPETRCAWCTTDEHDFTAISGGICPACLATLKRPTPNEPTIDIKAA